MVAGGMDERRDERRMPRAQPPSSSPDIAAGTLGRVQGGLEVGNPRDKLAVRVARQIEADVMRRGWPVGEALGSLADLRTRYPVSHAVLREAVLLIEHHQVARIRRGVAGGLFVVEPDAGPAAQAAVMYLSYAGTRVEDFLALRRTLEPLAAGLAAERITETGIARLRSCIAAEKDDHDGASWAPDAMHLLLAELSGNPALRLFVDVLTRLTAGFGDAVSRDDRRRLHEAEAEARASHAALAEAVTSGDATDAELCSRQHIDAIRSWFAGQPEATAPVLPSTVINSSAGGPPVKLAETLAARIHQDIVGSGWPIGTVLGNEPELLTRYGVSRAVLREAIRLLEYHGAVRMRTGPRPLGGLTVTRPDPQASTDTMALYLEYQQVRAEDLRTVREAIELGIVSGVVERHGSPAVRARLDQAAHDVDPARLTIDGDPTSLTHADLFHLELAELADNPVQTLFLRIITELWSRHRASQHRDSFGPEATGAVLQAHDGIVAAVLAGDKGLAQHRMRRHLDALTTWWH